MMPTYEAQTARSVRLYAALLRVLPKSFRLQFARAMLEVFADGHARARRSGRVAAMFLFWLRMASDLFVSMLREHTNAVFGRLNVSRRRAGITASRPHKNQDSLRGQGAGIMEGMLQDIRHTVRTLLKSPGFTATVVVTLALGIGANTAIFSLINDVLLKPLPIANQDEVVRLYTSDFSSGIYGSSSYPDYVDFRDRNTTLQDLAAYSYPLAFNFGTDEQAERVTGLLASGNYFSVLGVRPAAGRLLAPEDDLSVGEHPVVVISHGMWKRRFGGARDIVGRSITLNGHTFSVIGVAFQRCSPACSANVFLTI